MKRLIIGGFPCPREAWQIIFPSNNDQLIVPFSQIFSYYDGDFMNLIDCCQDIIQNFEPDSLILHDVSVTLGLVSMMRLMKKNHSTTPKITIFNGAFRGFNIFKARHPLKIQFISFDKMSSIVSNQGGMVDLYFKTQFSNVRKFYRQIALGSILAILKEMWPHKQKKQIDLENKILILASHGDSFIPYNCLERIHNDFAHTILESLDYGHFPYSSDNCISIYKRITEFERLQ